MAGMKKLMAMGLALAMALPTSVYAEEAEPQRFEYLKQEIKKEDNLVGYIVCMANMEKVTGDKVNFAKDLELTVEFLDKDSKVLEEAQLAGVTYSWVDPYAKNE